MKQQEHTRRKILRAAAANAKTSAFKLQLPDNHVPGGRDERASELFGEGLGTGWYFDRGRNDSG